MEPIRTQHVVYQTHIWLVYLARPRLFVHAQWSCPFINNLTKLFACYSLCVAFNALELQNNFNFGKVYKTHSRSFDWIDFGWGRLLLSPFSGSINAIAWKLLLKAFFFVLHHIKVESNGHTVHNFGQGKWITLQAERWKFNYPFWIRIWSPRSLPFIPAFSAYWCNFSIRFVCAHTHNSDNPFYLNDRDRETFLFTQFSAMFWLKSNYGVLSISPDMFN